MANAAPITGVCSCAPLNPKIDLPDLAMSAQRDMERITALLFAIDADGENFRAHELTPIEVVNRIILYAEMARDIAISAADTCEIIEVEARRIKREGC